MTLTEAGQRFVPHARKVVRDYQAAMDSVSGIRNKQKGTVVSGMFNSGNDVLAPLIPAFRALYPNINVRLIGSNSAQGADHVRSGRLEAGVVALPIDARGLTISDVLRPVGVCFRLTGGLRILAAPLLGSRGAGSAAPKLPSAHGGGGRIGDLGVAAALRSANMNTIHTIVG